LAFGGRLVRTPIFVAMTLITIGGVLMAHIPNFWVFAASLSAFNLGVTVSGAVSFGLMMRYLPTERFAVHFAAATGTMGAVGPYLGGLVISHFGLLSLQIACAVSFAVFGVLLCLYLRVAQSSHTPV